MDHLCDAMSPDADEEKQRGDNHERRLRWGLEGYKIRRPDDEYPQCVRTALAMESRFREQVIMLGTSVSYS
jgi:hypothetical protein